MVRYMDWCRFMARPKTLLTIFKSTVDMYLLYVKGLTSPFLVGQCVISHDNDVSVYFVLATSPTPVVRSSSACCCSLLRR